MARVEALDPLKYRSGYKYQTLERIRFNLPEEFLTHYADTPFIALWDCTMTLEAGYAFDGASGPTFDPKCSMRAAALHDACYQLMREGSLPRTLKPLVDDLFHELLIADGMNRFRAWLWHRGVKKCGESATIQNRNILVAP
jgi:hypothetical protein